MEATFLLPIIEPLVSNTCSQLMHRLGKLEKLAFSYVQEFVVRVGLGNALERNYTTYA